MLNHEFIEAMARQKQRETLQEAETRSALHRSSASVRGRIQTNWLSKLIAQVQRRISGRQRKAA